MKELQQYTFADNDVAKCPFDYYAAMRTSDPVHRDPGLGYFVISKYDDAVAVAQNPDAFSSTVNVLFRKNFKPAAQHALDAAGIRVVDTFVTSDPPKALDVHRVGMNLFPPKKIQSLRPRVQKLADELLDGLVGKGSVDIGLEFSRRLIGTMVAEQLELPPEDFDKFKRWTECTGELMKVGITEDEELAAIKKMIELMQYLAPHVRQARLTGKPGTAIHTVATMNKRDGSEFTENERCWMAFLTFTGGHNTTINMMNSDIRKLVVAPALQAELRAHPERIEAFVEEMLRLEGSAQAVPRQAMRDIEINGTLIPKGALVMVSLGSANRDEDKWGDKADQLCLERSDIRRHLTFGTGLHVCIGIHFARMMLHAGISALLNRTENIRLSDPREPPQQLPLPFHRGLHPFRVTLEGLHALNASAKSLSTGHR